MASLLSNTFRARPVLTSAAILSVAGVGATYYNSTRRPLLLDSTNNVPSQKTLSMPTGMLFGTNIIVSHVEQVNHDTKKITFSLPGGTDEIAGVPAGSAILTQHTPPGRVFPVFRPYTPIHDPTEAGILQLLVKKYPNGAASSHMHSLAPGQTLKIRGPLPGYSWTPSQQPRDLLFIAGGAGITPIYSLAKGVLSDPQDQEKTRINLLWGVNGTRDIVLKDELAQLQQQYPGRFDVTYVVSGPEGKTEAPGLPAGGSMERYRKGYINREILQEAIQRCTAEGRAWGDEKGTLVWVCGPPAMEEAVAGKKGVLKEMGVSKVHKF